MFGLNLVQTIGFFSGMSERFFLREFCIKNAEFYREQETESIICVRMG